MSESRVIVRPRIVKIINRVQGEVPGKVPRCTPRLLGLFWMGMLLQDDCMAILCFKRYLAQALEPA